METKIPLTDAEWHIMQALWAKGPMTIMEITRALEAETGWTKHTVITLLRRMEKKGTVRMEERGRAKVVHPLVDRDAVALAQARTLISRLYGGSLSLLVAEMVAGEDIPQEELEAMRRVIEAAREKEGDG